MTPELRSALDNAYDVFARYEYTHDLILPPGMSYHLRSLTLNEWHEIDADNEVGVLMFSDDYSLFRHFLPRWMEWISEDEREQSNLGFWDLWSLGYRLLKASWHEWPTPEITALRAVFLAWTNEALATYGSEPPLDFLIKIGEDLAPHLELWLDADLPALSRWLWTVNWPEVPGAQNWATSSRLESELEAAFFANPDSENDELFSRSVELVRSLRAI